MAEDIEISNQEDQYESDENMDNQSEEDEEDSYMDTESDSQYEMKQSSSLQMMLSSIAEERMKDHSAQKLITEPGTVSLVLHLLVYFYAFSPSSWTIHNFEHSLPALRFPLSNMPTCIVIMEIKI